MPYKIIDTTAPLAGMLGISHQISFGGVGAFNGILDLIGGLFIIAYFASVLYHKVIKIHYNGSWKKWVWSIRQHFRKGK